MNRFIKFKAWDKQEKQMIYPTFIPNEPKKDSNYVYLQYTGLKDVNGKEIYVGDIVKCTELRTEDELNEWISPIVYDDCDLIVHETKMCDVSLSMFFPGTNKMPLTEIEVIGNIYENPELIEQI